MPGEGGNLAGHFGSAARRVEASREIATRYAPHHIQREAGVCVCARVCVCVCPLNPTRSVAAACVCERGLFKEFKDFCLCCNHFINFHIFFSQKNFTFCFPQNFFVKI